MKRITIAAALTLALAGCGHYPSDAERALSACRGMSTAGAHDMCVANYVNTAQAGRDAQWSAIGAGMLAHPIGSSYSRPAATTCYRTGSITQCY